MAKSYSFANPGLGSALETMFNTLDQGQKEALLRHEKAVAAAEDARRFELANAQKDRSLNMQQQQTNFLYPEKLNLVPNALDILSQNPQQRLVDTFNTALSLRPDVQYVQPPVYNQNTGKYQVPTITPVQVPISKPVNRSPESETPVQDEDKMLQLQQIQASKAALAKSLGIEYDPATGALSASGPQAKYYMEYMQPLLAHEAQIMSSIGRPPTPITLPNQVINEAQSKSASKNPVETPYQKSLRAEKAQLMRDMSGLGSAILTPKEKEEKAIRINEIDTILNSGVVPAKSIVDNKAKKISQSELQAKLKSGEIIPQKNKATGQVRYIDAKTKAVVDVQ